MDLTQAGSIDIKISEKGIATITFEHPAHNSLPGKLLAKLAASITETGANAAVKVIVVKSAGDRTFCAGASFDELISINDFETGKKFFLGFANVINAMRKCPKIIIGRVQGKAVGGGVGLASAMDYCIATKYAAAKLSELNVGIGPFVVGPAVERKVGLSAFSQMTINANHFYPADWALQRGLYTEVHEDAEALDTAVMAMADYLLDTNPEAQSMLKEVFWSGCEHWDELLDERAAMSGRLVLSEFTKSALAAYG